MTNPIWMASRDEIAALVAATHADPFALLGAHAADDDVVVRAFVPGATTLECEAEDGTRTALHRRHDDGFFENLVAAPGAYRLHAANPAGAWAFHDPYRFAPVLGPLDDHLLAEGTHRGLTARLGAHVLCHQAIQGVHFAVWAPNARRVSVVGDFNAWDGRTHQMRRRADSGVWEIFAPDVVAGTAYKYEIVAASGETLPLKADPHGFAAEGRPNNASVVADPAGFAWTDAAWCAARDTTARDRPARTRPMSIYEVHLGSWRRHADGGFLSYDDLADQLVPYAAGMGFTHLEFMPISEHPLDASWGYQPIGLFAPTARFGTQQGFARLVDRAHAAGLAVILDWVPAHFPTDPHGLARFDGSALYEHEDPRLGFHPDWNTAIYNFGRTEVENFLIASALHWFAAFHIDALRVDAVASMLYLDYSRAPGEWVPNRHGGRANLEAEAFLRRVNTLAYGLYPGIQMIAEESTSWPKVSAPVDDGGLGFGFKWNMGWMNDTLVYLALDPIHRRWNHDKLTFGLLYGFTENFILPLSHDEVVHGKGSLLSRVVGDDWQRFATLRAYYAFMWAHPGKKLLFMGQEFAQPDEWNFDASLPWHLLDHPMHAGMQACVRDLNHLHATEPALHARDCEPDGFRWIVADDRDQSVIAWARLAGPDDAPVVMVSNFTPVPRTNYRIGMPRAGLWREVMNTDAVHYGGSGLGNLGRIDAEAVPAHSLPASASLTLPPLATLYFRYEAG